MKAKRTGCVKRVGENLLMMNDQKWLKYMQFGARLGCHQKKERSFFYKEYQFPVCARCTGVIISSCVAAIVYFISPIRILECLCLMMIMFIDWFVQRIGIKNSTNARRFITGLLGGYGFMTLQMYIYQFVFDSICMMIK